VLLLDLIESHKRGAGVVMADKHCKLEEAWDEDGTVWDGMDADDLTIEHAKCTIEMMGKGTPRRGMIRLAGPAGLWRATSVICLHR
jgi:hypothetical protein